MSQDLKWLPPESNALLLQYFRQNLGCQFGHEAIVTKRVVLRTGFFQAVPVGSVLTNAINQMLIEGTPLEARHGT